MIFTEEEAKNKIISIILTNKDIRCNQCFSKMRLKNANNTLMICTWKHCKKTMSIFHNTWFENSKDGLSTKLSILTLLFNTMAVKMTSIALNYNYKQVKKCISKLCKFIKKNYFNYSIAIADENVVIEMNKSKFGKRKYNRGHPVEGIWVIGLVEKSNRRKIVLVPVENRNASTCEAIVKKYILQGSHIYTDGWRGYVNIHRNCGFTNATVNHSVAFVDPVTSVHTNSIESSWSALKRQIIRICRTKKQYGCI